MKTAVRFCTNQIPSIESILKDEHIPYKAYNENNGWSLDNVKNNGQTLLQGGVKFVENVPQTLDNVNNFKKEDFTL